MYSRRAFGKSLLATGAASLVANAGDLAWLSLDEASRLIRTKKASPVELTNSCLRRIDRLNPSLNAYITVTAEQALAQARALEAEAQKGHFRGPLHGIPIALKDLFDTAGIKTTCASEQYRDRVPTEDAEVVRLLKEAGAVLLGKLNMDEFAYNFTAETSFFGAAHNPWDKKRTPGGSSGGSGVAVAAGLCYAALGSDTGGSIRLPATFCGIAGYKPTYGKVSTRGVTPLAWSLDHVGPMCRTARDAEAMFGVMSGRGLKDSLPPLKSIRLGVPRSTFYEKLDAQVGAAMDEALKLLGRLTAGVEDITLPSVPRVPELPVFPLPYLRIIQAESYAFHEEMLKRQPERYHRGTKRNIEDGASVTASTYIRARLEMDRLRQLAGSLFSKTGLWITPTAPGPAFELGSAPDLIFLRNTAPWNLYGLPTISIPCGFANGLPIGLQITGPAGGDDRVLALAAAYQQATDWHTKHPPV